MKSDQIHKALKDIDLEVVQFVANRQGITTDPNPDFESLIKAIDDAFEHEYDVDQFLAKCQLMSIQSNAADYLMSSITNMGEDLNTFRTRLDTQDRKNRDQVELAVNGVRFFSIVLGAVFSMSAIFGIKTFMDVRDQFSEIEKRYQHLDDLEAEFQEELNDAEMMNKRHTELVIQARRRSDNLLGAFRKTKDREFNHALKSLISSLRLARVQETSTLLQGMSGIEADIENFLVLAKSEEEEEVRFRSIKFPNRLELQYKTMKAIKAYADLMIIPTDTQDDVDAKMQKANEFLLKDLSKLKPSQYFTSAQERIYLQRSKGITESGEGKGNNELQLFAVSEEQRRQDENLKELAYLAEITRRIMEGNVRIEMLRLRQPSKKEQALESEEILELADSSTKLCDTVGSFTDYFEETREQLQARALMQKVKAHALLAKCGDNEQNTHYEDAMGFLEQAESIHVRSDGAAVDIEGAVTVYNNMSYIYLKMGLNEDTDPKGAKEYLNKALVNLDEARKFSAMKAQVGNENELMDLTEVELQIARLKLLTSAKVAEVDKDRYFEEIYARLQELLLERLQPSGSLVNRYVSGKTPGNVDLAGFPWFFRKRST